MKFLTSLFLVLALASTQAQAATTLKIATIAPDGTSWMKAMRKAGKQIEAETEGRVKIKYYPGGVQGSDQSVLRKMRIGQLQGGAVSSGAFDHIANAVQLYSMPFTFNSLDELRSVRKEFDPYIATALEEKGYILLGLSEGGFAYLMSNKAITSSKDIQDRKVWVLENDVVSRTTFEKGGVEPIGLPISDVYTSLQTGLIDTLGVNLSTSIALQWYTKFNYVTDYPLVFVVGMLVVDQRAFNKMSPEDQIIVRNTMKSAFDQLSEINAKDEVGARDALIQNAVEFVELTDEDKLEWRKLAKEAVDELADKDAYPIELYKQLVQTLESSRTTAE